MPARVQTMLAWGTVLKEGHLSAPRDAGHTRIYISDGEEDDSWVHEGQASLELAQAVAGPHVEVRPMDSGKTFLLAQADGLVRIGTRASEVLNDSDIALLISRPDFQAVRRHDLLAVLDILPLRVPREALDALAAEVKAMEMAVALRPFRPLNVGLLITGSEIYTGRIPDVIAPVVRAKVSSYGGSLHRTEVAPDDEASIVQALEDLVANHDVVIVTGGMSIDPTDCTPHAIRRVADVVVNYGIPVMPNAMSMVATKGKVTILGISAGLVHYQRENVLDRLLPLVCSGEPITRLYLINGGVGGLMPSFLRDVAQGQRARKRQL
jgi:molybdenum cofactor synthesis domain-containing protein